jgi:hypothetical protein
MWSAGDGDDNRRFLADLRALRDTAALEFDELAARAHYPSDVLKEAESGPSLPSLPILAAYVRACDADVPEWEERWRRLGFEAHADPGLPVRPAGASPAAVAGARAGVGVVPPESYDAERIRAVLRGSHASSDRGARGTVSRGTAAAAGAEREGPGTATAEPRVPESPATWSAGTSWDETTRWDADRGAGWDTDAGADTVAGWGTDTGSGWDTGLQPDPDPHWDGAAANVPDAGPGWDGATTEVPDAGPGWDGATTDLSGVSANGNHHASEPDDGPSDTAVIETPGADQADATARDPFSTAWLQDTELTSPPDPEPGWQQDQAEAGPPPANWFAPNETADREQARPSADIQPSPAVADTWFTPRERTDDGAPPERDVARPPESTVPVTGFWTPSAAAQSPTTASAPGPAAAPAEVRRPDPPQAEGPTVTRAAWPAASEAPAGEAPAGEAPAGNAPGPVDRTTQVPAQSAAATPSRTIAGPAVPPRPVVPPSEPRADRLYPVRLLMVIVVAALIGSVLVLLLR